MWYVRNQEFILHLLLTLDTQVAPINTPGPSWSGISHYGQMPNGLLLMFWPNGNEILTSFRYARYVYSLLCLEAQH